MDQTTTSPQPNLDLPPTFPGTATTSSVFTPTTPQNGNRKKVIGAILGVLLLVVGLVSGLFLVRQQQLFDQKAWDCSAYRFVISQTGAITAINGSAQQEPLQKADVYINNQKVLTVDIPNLTAGQSAPVGNVVVPASGGFNWEVRGLTDCSSTGSYQAKLEAKCIDIKAYDENWAVITTANLAKLKTGNKVRFAVAGNTTSGAFSKARFTINGVLGSEVTTKRPTTNDYYFEYTIPAGTTSFSVKAELFHNQLNGWF